MIGRIVALAAIAVLMGSSVVPTEAKDGLSDKATLAQDRMVIEDTLRRYVRALDDSELDAYLATLTDDAKFVSAEGIYAGKEAIRRMHQTYESRLNREMCKEVVDMFTDDGEVVFNPGLFAGKNKGIEGREEAEIDRIRHPFSNTRKLSLRIFGMKKPFGS